MKRGGEIGIGWWGWNGYGGLFIFFLFLSRGGLGGVDRGGKGGRFGKMGDNVIYLFIKKTVMVLAPWAPRTRDCSMSAVLEGPAMKVAKS